ncbi:hypothetical protein BZL30_1823 [Mycobacterium kansasii]|uniref:Pilin n=1 Tax=Mycobacterium kansasii TaxID=1768 RepID=A0A1V3XHG7_MYCKA|nr:hypothetical protein BZL30_1823 [Mycobacterium kansasii]
MAVAPEIQAAPAPVPQWWCPGDFWDPGWGNNWDWNNCHDNWRGPGPNPNGGPGWGLGRAEAAGRARPCWTCRTTRIWKRRPRGRALTRGYPAAIRPLSAGCVQRGVTPSVA